LAYGYLIGSIFPFIILLPVLFRIRVLKNVKFNYLFLVNFLKIALPLFLGSLLFRFTNIFEKIIASTLTKGNISYLGYSTQILLVLSTLTSNGISVVIFPILSKLWFNNNHQEIKEYINKGVRIIFILTIPISVLLIFYSDFIIGIIFQRGQFTSEATIAVSKALNFSIGAFIFQSIGSIVIKMFYISGHTKINTIISVIEVLIYISIANYLVKKYSLVGLPIALSISSGLSVFASILYLNKYILKINMKLILIDFFKLLFISLISILLVNFLFNKLFIINTLLTFILSLISGLILFLFLALKFRISEILLIMTPIINKIKQNKTI
jgi:putative peptidoglycan lipid II flippase